MASPLAILTALLFIYHTNTFNLDVTQIKIATGHPDSYFGYSVAFLRNTSGLWLLAGAPRDNDTYQSELTRPGALHACRTDGSAADLKCSQVEIDATGNTKVPRVTGVERMYIPDKNNQWLGVSLQVHDASSRVLVCAHRWKDTKYKGNVLGNGFCYALTGALAVYKPLPALLSSGALQIQDGLMHYAYGQAGTSSTFTSAGEILLGCPGLADWKGGIVHYNTQLARTVLEAAWLPPDSYFGYAVTSGKFYADGKDYFVASSPRFANIGMVVIFFEDFNGVKNKLIGRQFGSYFGASICAVDVNGDGLDDILVGAPLYSDVFDEGRVYIYINRDLGLLEEQLFHLRGSRAVQARFGSAIIAVNLDSNQYRDVAVGAPFEDDGRGAIYIYNGHANGIHIQHSQRLAAKILHSNLKGFGTSMSAVVGKNNITDIAIGSPFSNMVVLLKTLPVVELQSRLTLTPRELSIGALDCYFDTVPSQCFRLTVCVKVIPSFFEITEIDIFINVSFDVLKNGRKRVSTGRTYEDRTTLRIEHGLSNLHPQFCFNKSFKIHEWVADFLTPIQIDADVGLIRNSSLYPILSPSSKTKLIDKMMFIRDCGEDNVCHSDLRVFSTVLYRDDTSYVMLGQDELSIHLRVANFNESAYQARVFISFPEFLGFIGVDTGALSEGEFPVACAYVPENDSPVSNLDCDVGNPVKLNDTILFNIRFSARRIPAYVNNFHVTISFTTASVQRNDASVSNNITHDIQIMRRSELLMFGASKPEQISFEPASDKDLAVKSSTDFTHVYNLVNHGPSPLRSADIQLKVPTYSTQGQTVLAVLSAKAGISKLSMEHCSITSPVAVDNVTYTRSRNSESILRLTMNCSSSSECALVRCNIHDIIPGDGTTMEVTFRLHKYYFELLQVHDIAIVSTAEIILTPDNFTILSAQAPKPEKVLSTIFFPVIQAAQIQGWILALAIICGILLLLLATLTLWKCDFFKRPVHIELQRLIQQKSASGAEDDSDTDSFIMALRNPAEIPESPSPTTHGNIWEEIVPLKSAIRDNGAMHNPTYQVQESCRKKNIPQNQAAKNILAYDYPKSKATSSEKAQDITKSSAVDSTSVKTLPNSQAASNTFNSPGYDFPKSLSDDQKTSSANKQAANTFAHDVEREQTNYINVNVNDNYDFPTSQNSKL